MTAFLQNCLNGISIGSIYALIAIGYTMVYGILRLINFAHGDIFMMAGYFMIICMTDLLIPWYISLLLVVLFTVLLGVFIERIAYKPLRDAPRMSIMISAIGVSYFLQNFATYLFTAQPKSYPYAEMGFLSKTVKLGEISTTLVTFITPILTVILVLALAFLIRKTKIGMAMRAVSRDFETSCLMGIKINRVISFTFAVGVSAGRFSARAQVLCRRGVRRHRLHSRRTGGRLPHRSLRNVHQGQRLFRVQRRFHIRRADPRAARPSHRPVR